MSDETSVLYLEEIFARIKFGFFQVMVIVIFGFIQFFYAAETVLLSFLGPILICTWKITLLDASFITMALFVGMTIGSIVFGKISDCYGRKLVIVMSGFGIFYFSILCALSPTIIWIIITRCLIGIFIGGFSTMVYTYLTEVMTIEQRGTAVICVQLFWSMGSYYISILTIVLVPTYGWRIWLIISVAPMFLILIIALYLPESPRYLLIQNKVHDAITVVNHIASINKSQQFSNVKYKQYKQSSYKDMFHQNYIVSTIICMYICFVSGISFYGFVFSSSVVNHIPHKCLQNMKTILHPSVYINKTIDSSCCPPINWYTMKTVIISITGELFSYIIGITLIKYIKRKIYLQILLLINALVYFLMNFCLSPLNVGILMMFGRGSGGTILRVNLLYISEVFPTNIRSLSIGIGNSFVRTGAMFSSLMVNMVMIKYSYLIGTLIYGAINIIGVFLVFFLPYETKNRSLPQSVEDDIEELNLLSKKD